MEPKLIKILFLILILYFSSCTKYVGSKYNEESPNSPAAPTDVMDTNTTQDIENCENSNNAIDMNCICKDAEAGGTPLNPLISSLDSKTNFSINSTDSSLLLKLKADECFEPDLSQLSLKVKKENDVLLNTLQENSLPIKSENNSVAYFDYSFSPNVFSYGLNTILAKVRCNQGKDVSCKKFEVQKIFKLAEWYYPKIVTKANDVGVASWINLEGLMNGDYFLKSLPISNITKTSTALSSYGAKTDRIYATHFSPNIPADYLLKGIEIKIGTSLDQVNDSNNVVDHSLKFIINGSESGVNLSNGSHDWGYSSEFSIGGPNTNFGLTRDIVNSENFGISLSAKNDNSSEWYKVYVHYIRIKYYIIKN